MTKRLQAKYKKSRRLGVALWGEANDPFHKKNYKPGMHGPVNRSTSRLSDFGNQLRAKQQMKFYYGDLSEKQFHGIYAKALKRKGDTGENMVRLLESRLATIIYRMNVVPSVFAARQLVNHKHVMVNGRVVNIGSFQVKVGDIIEIREKSKKMAMILEALQKKEREIPPYMELDVEKISCKLTNLPEFKDVPYPVEMEPHLVVELYSR